MSALELEVYGILKSKFSEAEAAKVITYFDEKSEEKISQKKMFFLLKMIK
jgi:hypothetical protein